MKKLIMLVLLAVAGILVFYFWNKENKPRVETPKQQPVAVSKYSAEFNQSIHKVLEQYYSLSEAFVNWDSAAVTSRLAGMRSSIGELRFEEIKKDTPIYETAVSYLQSFESDIQSIASGADLTAKRRAFNGLSQNLYDLLRTVKFDASKVFLQECRMAFNDTEAAIWLSKESAIRNPYMGLYHPTYKAEMLVCGDTRDSLAFGGGAP